MISQSFDQFPQFVKQLYFNKVNYI